jgi:PLP dependent protein
MSDIPKDVTVVCASKYFDVTQMRQLYRLGQRHFGENRAQDLISKMEQMADLDIVWHFIGHLQTNKVQTIINHIDVLHTLDRLKLAKIIQSLATSVKACFIQVNMTGEDQKSGLDPRDLTDFLKEIRTYDKIKVIGLMTIGKAGDPIQTAQAFQALHAIATAHGLTELSMGMSDDYKIALDANATYLRIGRTFLKALN